MAEEVQFAGGNAIQRIRLPEENENPNSASSQSLMDENLLQYYKFLADKGDVQAQVGWVRYGPSQESVENVFCCRLA